MSVGLVRLAVYQKVVLFLGVIDMMNLVNMMVKLNQLKILIVGLGRQHIDMIKLIKWLDTMLYMRVLVKKVVLVFRLGINQMVVF